MSRNRRPAADLSESSTIEHLFQQIIVGEGSTIGRPWTGSTWRNNSGTSLHRSILTLAWTLTDQLPLLDLEDGYGPEASEMEDDFLEAALAALDGEPFYGSLNRGMRNFLRSASGWPALNRIDQQLMATTNPDDSPSTLVLLLEGAMESLGKTARP